jgi:hypothetical protein
MNIIDFVQYPSTKVKTACGWDVTITEIVPEDKYPIKGTYYVDSAKINSPCEWDVEGNPHNLPTTHGLDLVPFLPKREWYKVDKEKFKNAVSYADLVKSS